jgi:hypothetical protein
MMVFTGIVATGCDKTGQQAKGQDLDTNGVIRTFHSSIVA